MRKMAVEHVERYIEEGLARVIACRPDIDQAYDGSIGKVKILLSYFYDNEMSFIASFFLDSICKGPAAFLREFYVDDRAWGGKSRSNRWADAITTGMARRVLGQLEKLEAGRAAAKQSNPRSRRPAARRRSR